MGRSRAAWVGVPVGRGWGAVTVVLSGVPTAAGNALGAQPGWGKPGLHRSRFRSLWVGQRALLAGGFGSLHTPGP